MKSEPNPALVSQPEKPQHYTYLKEFRTQQCPLFLQHKCTQHRPYTCFHWHFANQRRRRPVRKRDGTFNYTPDSYCAKYDEQTGVCPNGDDCPFVHRNAGDTERRYHIRYFKTAICVHETDPKGICGKNGVHCAFAHGSQDLRNPTYDVRELQALERGESPSESLASIEMSTSMEKEKILNDDPKWNDSQYVLANYKTEPCKRPPRLCRQGYACPQYHNSKDRRRNPKVYKYRSTPCPQVKQNDEWGDPALCDTGDQCQYCHTRTEQQFYPEIYKSTKCKDMVQTGYCPRGPFCAFAHVDQEINMNKEAQLDSPRQTNSLGSFIPSAFHEETCMDHEASPNGNSTDITYESSRLLEKSEQMSPVVAAKTNDTQSKDLFPSPKSIASNSNRSLSSSFSEALGSSLCSLPDPIGKGRSMSLSEYQRSNSVPSNRNNGTYSSSLTNHEVSGRTRVRPISGDSENGLHIGYFDGLVSNNSSHLSPFANSFYPPGDTVESVIGNAMDEITLGDYNYIHFPEDPVDLDRGDSASVCSSISAGLASSYLGNSFSLPMSLSDRLPGSVSSLSQSPPSSPLGTLPMGIPQQNRSSVFPSASRFSSLGTDLNTLISPRSQRSNNLFSNSNNSNLLTNGIIPNGSYNTNDLNVQKLKDEVSLYKYKLERLEEGARGAYDVLKREVDETNRKCSKIEEEKELAMRQRDEALHQVELLRRELEYIKYGKPIGELINAPLGQLTNVHRQLSQEMEQIQQLIARRRNSMECIKCPDNVAGRPSILCNNHNNNNNSVTGIIPLSAVSQSH